MSNMEYCRGYVGLSCVDGSCPKIYDEIYGGLTRKECDEFQCEECGLFKGCEDCWFDKESQDPVHKCPMID